MRAVVVDDQGVQFQSDYTGTVVEQEVPVGVIMAGICQTDLQLARGYMGFRGVLGHEFVGVAEAGQFAGRRVVGEINCSCRQCPACRSGWANHCPHRTVIGILNHDGAFADRVYVPENNLHPVPDSLPDEVAVFTEPVAAAFQISQQVDLSRHERAVVVGDGRLGYLIAQVLRDAGCGVTVVGKHAHKLQAFQQLGADTQLVSDQAPSRTFTLAVDCSASNSGIQTALRYLQPRGILVLKTTIAADTGPALAALVIDEITVVGSRCGPFDVALEALAAGRIEVTSLITARYPIEQAEQAFVAAASPTHRKVLLNLD